MTYRTRQRWPAIPQRVRHLIESRTPLDAPCTLIVERDDFGLILSFHGAIRATAAPSPEEVAELIDALRRAAGAP